MSKIDPFRIAHFKCDFDFLRYAAVACLTSLGFQQEKIRHESTINTINEGDIHASVILDRNVYLLILAVVKSVRLYERGGGTIEHDTPFTKLIACEWRSK